MGLLKRYLDWRLRNVVAVEVDEGGFRVRRGRTASEVRWSSIDAVTAFKRDLLTVDCLCLLIRSANTTIELDERMQGFEGWLAMLETRLGIAREWRLSVLFPAFDTSATEIFRREPLSAALGEPI